MHTLVGSAIKHTKKYTKKEKYLKKYQKRKKKIKQRKKTIQKLAQITYMKNKTVLKQVKK